MVGIDLLFQLPIVLKRDIAANELEMHIYY